MVWWIASGAGDEQYRGKNGLARGVLELVRCVLLGLDLPPSFSSLFFFFFLSFFPLSFFSPSFQDKLDKMQIGSGEDVNDLNYDYDNEQCVARGGN